MSLLRLFNPERVAVIGATPREGSVGRGVMENLRSFGGEVVGVNPKHDEVLGFRCYDNISSVPGSIDLAVVVVPADSAVGVVESLGERGVENVVVLTAGFGESGTEGADREKALVEAAERHSVRLVGPNSLGVASTSSSLNSTFGPASPQGGNVSFMSQSGAFVTAAVDWSNDARMGFRHIVSLGNKAVLDETDFAEAWGGDDGTGVVVGYLEGVEDGDRFVRVLRTVTRDTPVVLVKSGKTEEGARAVSSHTGTLAGSDRAYDAAFRKAGVVRADDVEELFDFARALDALSLPDGDGVAVVTNAGGPGVMATDALGDTSLSLAEFDETTYEELREALPQSASFYNPVDILGDAPSGRFAGAVEAVADDPGVAACLVIACPTTTFDFTSLAEALVDADADVPVVASLMGGETTRDARNLLSDNDIPTYFDPARAVRSLEAVADYRRARSRETGEVRDFDTDREKANRVLEAARDHGRLGVEATPLLEAYGIPTPESEVVRSPDDAARVAEAMDGEVVMKIV
ncbi:MAG: acetate--CoA ligase family protein, partial [Halobacteriales archaeon]